MMKKIIDLVEHLLSPEELDVFDRYSKDTPHYILDNLIKRAENKGINISISREDENNFYLSIGDREDNPTIKKVPKLKITDGSITYEDLI